MSSSICTNAGFTSLTGIINWVTCTLINAVVPMLFALAIVGFIWGIIKYFLNPDNEEKKKQGKTFMLWGLIALFVMTSMWGIVKIFSGTLDINSNNNVIPSTPQMSE